MSSEELLDEPTYDERCEPFVVFMIQHLFYFRSIKPNTDFFARLMTSTAKFNTNIAARENGEDGV